MTKAYAARIARWAALALSLALLMGCAAAATSARYQHLDAQTQLSNTVFLQPMPMEARTIYVEVRNSTNQNFNIGPEIQAALAARGYRIVADPNQANLTAQIYVLSVARSDSTALEQAPGMAQAGVLGGAIGGAVLGGRHPLAGAAIGALAMGLAEGVTGSTTMVIWYGVMADVQIAQRVPDAYGNPSWRRHYTRVTSGARQVNLAWETAYPYLRNGLVQAIGGMF